MSQETAMSQPQPPRMPRHSAYLVDDLEGSMAAFSAIAGVAFDPIRSAPMRTVGAGVDLTAEVRFAYSTDGTIEIVEAGERGMFGPDVPRGFHHIGQLADVDLDVAVKRHLALGDTVEWEVYLGDFRLAVHLAAVPGRPRTELMSPDVLTRTGG